MFGTMLLLVSFAADAPQVEKAEDWIEPRDAATYHWEAELAAGRLRTGRIEKGWLILENPTAEDAVLTVWVLENPPLQLDNFGLWGEVRAENVPGEGFLEMMVRYPDGNEYFTRAISSSGPMAKLAGSFAARRWLLPFHGDSAAISNAGKPNQPNLPNRLVLQVVIPAGTKGLALGPPTLRQYPPGIDILAYEGGAWWSPAFSARLGAVGGVVGGLIGGLLGILAGLPRTRRFAYLLLWLFLASGVIALFVAAGAIFARQPLFVAFPLILVGTIVTVVAGVLIPVLRKRLAEDAEAAEFEPNSTPIAPGSNSPANPPTAEREPG